MSAALPGPTGRGRSSAAHGRPLSPGTSADIATPPCSTHRRKQTRHRTGEPVVRRQRSARSRRRRTDREPDDVELSKAVVRGGAHGRLAESRRGLPPPGCSWLRAAPVHRHTVEISQSFGPLARSSRRSRCRHRGSRSLLDECGHGARVAAASCGVGLSRGGRTGFCSPALNEGIGAGAMLLRAAPRAARSVVHVGRDGLWAHSVAAVAPLARASGIGPPLASAGRCDNPAAAPLPPALVDVALRGGQCHRDAHAVVPRWSVDLRAISSLSGEDDGSLLGARGHGSLQTARKPR